MTRPNLNDPPEPQVAGYGHFHDRVKTDGSAPCETSTMRLANECMPGGLLLKFKTAFESCEGLDLSDDLGLFEWKCSEEGGLGVFYADYGYDGTTKPLTELIDLDNNQFKENALTLTVDGTPSTSGPVTWWTDDIEEAPLASVSRVTLPNANTIYLLKANQPVFYGYDIHVTGISLLGTEDYELTAAAGLTANFDRTMPNGAPMTQKTMIFVNGAGYGIIETPRLEGNNAADVGVGVYDSFGTWIGRVTSMNTNSAAIALEQDYHTYISSFTSLGGGSPGEYAFDAYISTGLFLTKVKARGTENGILIRNAMNFGVLEALLANVTSGTAVTIQESNNGTSLPLVNRSGVMTKLRISNTQTGIAINQSENVSLNDFLISDAEYGIQIDSGENHRITQGTLTRLYSTGVRLHSTIANQPAGTIFRNLVLASMPTGFDITENGAGTRTTLFSDIIFGPITSRQVNAPGVNTSLQFYDQFVHIDPTLPSNVRCDIGASASNISGNNDGISDCLVSNPDARRLVNWTTPNSNALAQSVVGKPTAQVTANPTTPRSGPNNNEASFNHISDFFSFARNSQVWGQASTPIFPTLSLTDTEVRCAGGDTCEIFDFATGLAGATNILRRRTTNTIADYLTLALNPQTPSSTRDFPHSFPQGSEVVVTCPSPLRGTHGGFNHKWILPSVHADAGTPTILRYAVEMPFDGIGNDNTLCEAGEQCTYTPNFGFYQGSNTKGFGPCDQSGDSNYEPANDEFLIFGHGQDGV
jgi:hypothetical protein